MPRRSVTRAPIDRLVTRDEAFRVLRANLAVAIQDLENPVVVITSAEAGEGKTSTAAMLARSMAAAGTKVVLVDLDFRNPDLHRRLGALNTHGAADILRNEMPLEACLQFIEQPNGRQGGGFYFLSAGEGVANPAELLGASRTPRMLDVLVQQAEVVLIDTPPVLPVADTLVIGRLVAGAVLVTEARRTPTPALQRAKAALIRNQTRILGVVLNKQQRRDTQFGYGYGYGYGYGPEPS